ncbi:MAG TPA: response regulator, partial [Terracidiphilus sp.]|nr:response regulator [Terracidiphilus sp.]
CAPSGESALALMEASAFDVIVSDMRMPEMDGAALLTKVRDRFPGVVRMVLSGYTSLESALRAVPVAHQFLLKPCDPNLLRVTVDRACELKDLLGSDTILRTVGAMHGLPALPRTYAAMAEALSDPEVGLDRIGRIVEQDMSLAARVLQLVNSAMFGLRQRISTVRTAVSYLGTEIIRNLVLSVEAFRAFDGVAAIGGYSLEMVHAHAYLTARIASRLPAEKSVKETAGAAALLHDVGRLVLMARLPKEFARIARLARDQGRPLYDVEREVVGVTHAEIGAYLLGLWGLPLPIVEAAAFHHNPSQVPHQVFDCLAAVHVADALAHTQDSTPPGTGFASPSLDRQYLADLGVADCITEWESMAAEVAAEENGG